MLCLGLKEHHTKSSALRIQDGTLAQPSTQGSSTSMANAGSRLSSGSALLFTSQEQFSQHPLRHRDAAADYEALPFWVWQLPTIPFVLPISQVVLGQLRRKEKPQEEDCRLPSEGTWEQI